MNIFILLVFFGYNYYFLNRLLNKTNKINIIIKNKYKRKFTTLNFPRPAKPPAASISADNQIRSIKGFSISNI